MKNNFLRGAIAACPRGLCLSLLAILLMISFVITSCSSSKKKVEDIGGDDTSGDTATEPQPPPTATIEVSYSRPNDSMERVTVNKYFGADVIQSAQTRSGRSASVIRFDGGVPIWEIKADRSLAGRITDIGTSGWAVKTLEYGKVPPHFAQILPDEGPPEPLDRGSFYVFAIERASGSVSYQAVKVLADGSLQSYAAQPRAGSSFLVCCGLASDFSEPVILPEEISPDDNSQDNSGSPDQSGGGDSGDSSQPQN
ncbi:MAG TPA: hypothetical protein VMH37_00870 [Candidatus Binataceae bacterium]|nr:hypothetical protein [Candidatus Binataceae bacterium]